MCTNDRVRRGKSVRKGLAILLIGSIAVVAWWYYRETLLLDDALGVALKPLIDKQATDESLVARIIWESYLETRSSASRWSGVSWGFTFAAAVLSALAALVLKFETFLQNEKAKKDIAATLSVMAALLITISTSGDFQRKWQANRTAAALLERTGYDFLEKDGENPRAYLAAVGQILLDRSMAIAETADPPVVKAPAGEAGTKAE